MAMKSTHKKGLIRLVIILSVLLPGWVFKEYFACRVLLFFVVASCVIHWLIGRFFNVD